jgi:hypothetical protein
MKVSKKNLSKIMQKKKKYRKKTAVPSPHRALLSEALAHLLRR